MEPDSRGMEDKLHEAMPSTPPGAALGETVKAGLDRAGGLVKDAADKTRDALAGYRDGGVEQIAEDIAEYVRRQPMTALLIATESASLSAGCWCWAERPRAGNIGFLNQ